MFTLTAGKRSKNPEITVILDGLNPDFPKHSHI